MKKGGDILKSTTELHRERSKRQGLRIVIAVSLFVLGPLLFPAASSAASITGESTTYLQSRETADGTKELPLYEYLNFGVQDIGKDTISFQFGGWLRYDLKDNTDKEFKSRDSNDLSYAFLSYRSKSANTTVNLGRVMVFEGVASERVDGIYAKTDLTRGYAISGFGGIPAETGTDLPGNATIYGTRVSHQIPGLYQVGLSYLKEEKNNTDFRKEEGVDLWYKPLGKVELMGKSRYNGETSAWSDHNYVLVLGPFDKVRLNTEASLINYKDYFTASTTAVFKFDPVIIDRGEKVRVLGEEVVYEVNKTLNISANYRTYAYEIAGDAKYYGANIRYAVVNSGGAGLSMHKMAGDTDRLKYSEYRAYGYRKLGNTDVTLDVMDVAYDAAVNGVKNAYSVTLAAAYELTERMKIGADVEYSKNPDFDKDIRTLIKLTYNFDTAKTYHKEAPEHTSPAPSPAPETLKPAIEQSSPATTPAPETPKPAGEQSSAPAPQSTTPVVEQTVAPAPAQSMPVAAPEQDKRKEGAQ